MQTQDHINEVRKTIFNNSALCFVSRSIEVVLPHQPPEYKSLPHWLSELTDSKLKKLLEQGDSQRVRELSLALITVLNEVGPATKHWLIHLSVQSSSTDNTLNIRVPVFTFFQYEQTRETVRVSLDERSHRVRVRSNITRALTALDLTTVSDIQQTSAALAQCTVSRMRGRREGRIGRKKGN